MVNQFETKIFIRLWWTDG